MSIYVDDIACRNSPRVMERMTCAVNGVFISAIAVTTPLPQAEITNIGGAFTSMINITTPLRNSESLILIVNGRDERMVKESFSSS